MKVCFFHLKAYAVFNSKSDAPIGGTLVQMHVLAKQLSELSGFSVSFLTGDFGQSDEEVFDGIRVYKSTKLERRLRYYLRAPFSIWMALKKIDADVYIASSAGTEIGLVALFCRMHGKKMIYRTAHEWDCSGEYRKQHGFSGCCFEYGLRAAGHIVTQSEEHHVLLQKSLGLDSVIIKNSYHLREKNSLEKKTGVLWVSRCEQWKHPQLCIELAKKFPEHPFIMICPMQKHQEDFFYEIKRVAQNQINIEFIDFVPFEDIQVYFDRARVFVGTSEYEGFPNTYLQACMGGTPIVSYKVNPDHFIDRNDLGLCAQGEVGNMVSGLSRLLTDDARWQAQSHNASRYVAENHDIKKNIDLWLQILRG